ncbi:hypothetical protein MKX03_001230, partial [Papaver bracteatum]
SFMVTIDDYEVSSTSTPLFPPGFETALTEISDDASSVNLESTDSLQVVPKKLKSELKRLGITTTDYNSPATRRLVKARGIHSS